MNFYHFLKMAARVVVEDREFAFSRRLQTFSIVNMGHKTIEDFFADAFEPFQRKLNNIVEEYAFVKVGTCFICKFVKTMIGENGVTHDEEQKIYMHTHAEAVDFETNMGRHYNENVVLFFKDKIDAIEMRGSGFSLSEIIELNVQLSKFEPFAGSSTCSYQSSCGIKRQSSMWRTMMKCASNTPFCLHCTPKNEMRNVQAYIGRSLMN